MTLGEEDGLVRFEVTAKPRARRNLLRRGREGRLEALVTEAPEDGRANAAIVLLLASALGVARRDVELLRGASSGTKLFGVRGLTAAEVEARLASV